MKLHLLNESIFYCNENKLFGSSILLRYIRVDVNLELLEVHIIVFYLFVL